MFLAKVDLLGIGKTYSVNDEMSWFDYLSIVPYSTFSIFLVNFCLVITISFIFKLFVNVVSYKEQESEIYYYDRAVDDAKKRNDKALIRKLKRREARMKAISKSVSRDRLISLMVITIPFTITSSLMGTLYIGTEVVIFPFDLALFNKFNSFHIWNTLTYFGIYLPLSRILKTLPALTPSYEESYRRK